MALRVVPLTADLEAAWEDLFAACGSGCFCRYWHFGGSTNDWLARLALAPEQNLAEQRADLAANEGRSRGVVALRGDEVVGWMKLAPRAELPKLRSRSVYRTKELGADDGVYSVGCFLVHPSHRRIGVARALLEAGGEIARNWGGRAIEAYPHRRSEALRDEEVWMGPLSLFEQCGFQAVAGDDPYPLFRKVLTPRPT